MSRLREEINSYVSVPGALCMVAAGWLYLAASHVNEEARRVSQAYVLDSLSDARKLERLLPMLVALRGRVDSNDPKKCELSDRKAVIHEAQACQVRLVKLVKDGTRSDLENFTAVPTFDQFDQSDLASLCLQVQEEDILLVKGPTGAPERKPFDTRRESTEREWCLADDSGCSIKVVRGREALPSELGTVLEVAQEYNEQREGVKHSTMQTVSQIITGGRYQGHKKTEKFLPVGAIVTVVGELARNSISTGTGLSMFRYLLQPPAPRGSPFIITNKTITELHLALARRAGHYKTLAWCLGGVGAFLVVRKATRQVLRHWRERQARERVRKALQQQRHFGDGSSTAADGSSGGWDAEAGIGGGQQHGRDPGAGVCVVCLSAPSEMVYVKCGHMCCCSRCVATLGGGSRKCPVCRTEGSVIKVFRT